jgi:hypothetical protein
VPLAKKTNVSLAEIETNFFETERPGSLLQRFARAEEVANLVFYYSSPLSNATNGAAIREWIWRLECQRRRRVEADSANVRYVKSLTIPSLISRTAIAAREETCSLANIRRKCVETVHGLISKISAIVLVG